MIYIQDSSVKRRSAPPILSNLERVSQEEWKRFNVHVSEGDRFFQQGDFESARSAYHNALKINEDPDIVYAVGEIHLYLHNPAKAMEFFRRYMVLKSEEE